MKTSKVTQWNMFSNLVTNHIINYVIHQYGDFPDKMVKGFTPEKIQMKLEHLVGRIGRSSRGREDELRDCLKIAHYACYLYMLQSFGSADKIT